MGGYIRWQAARYEEIQTGLKAQISQLREKAYRSGQHRRTPDIVANLAVGFRYFLDFAQDAGAVDQSLAEELWQRCWDALGEAAAAQGDHQADSEPVGRFFELLISALSSGRAHLARPGGGSPDQPKAWVGGKRRAALEVSAAMDFNHEASGSDGSTAARSTLIRTLLTPRHRS